MQRIARAIARRLVFPLKDALMRRNTLSVLRDLQRSQWLPRQQVEGLQAERLRHTLRHARDHVPYYRELFRNEGIEPDDVRGTADLARIPFLTRQIVRRRGEELIATDRSRSYSQRVGTSGSTGEPLSFLCDATSMAYRFANQIRGRRWHGVEIGDSEIQIRLDPRDFPAGSLLAGAFLTANALKDRLLNIRIASTRELSEENLAGLMSTVQRVRPRVIYGYGVSIYFLARFLRERNVSPESLGVESVFVTAEKVLPPQKQTIADAFAADVLEEYGSAECGIIAFECERGMLHTSDESAVVEIVDTDAGGAGEIVVTTLVNDLAPLIRYRIGDVGVGSNEPCPCGRGLGVMKELVGRTADFLLNARGHRVIFGRVAPSLERIEKILRYRLEQRAIGSLELIVQATGALEAAEVETVRAAVRTALGDDTELRIRYVESLPGTAGGKHRFVRCLVGHRSDEHP